MSTAIEWCDETWNPVTGCTEVSTGCDHCYARTLAHSPRLRDRYSARLPVVDTAENRADPFAVRLWPERIAQPSKWREPRMVFVNSMSDLFHKDVPFDFLAIIWTMMMTESRHTYQVLTKRPAIAAKLIRRMGHSDDNPVPPHIWIGTSVENQDVEFRVGQLRAIPATVRFLSCEPLLGPIQFVTLDGIHWVIGGGESGAHFRMMNADDARLLRDQCVDAGVPFFFKQWGGRTPKAGGRLLDGREWNEYPNPVPA